MLDPHFIIAEGFKLTRKIKWKNKKQKPKKKTSLNH